MLKFNLVLESEGPYYTFFFSLENFLVNVVQATVIYDFFQIIVNWVHRT